MLNYIYGKVIYVAKTFIIIDNNGLGYRLRTANTNGFVVGEFMRVYTSVINKIDTRNNLNQEMFGFLNSVERQLFSDLLSIHGIGSTIACNIIQHGFEKTIKSIIHNDKQELHKIKSVSEKCATLIVSNLYDKYKKYIEVYDKNTSNKIIDDLVLVLRELGYNNNDIELAIKNCDENISLEEMIKKSIQIIAETNCYAKS